MREPLLYLSLFLKTHHSEYYRLLQEVRERGSWEAWPEFFLEGVSEVAEQAFEAATRILALFKQDREHMASARARAGSALRIHDLLQRNLYATAAILAERTGLSTPTINTALADLERLNIIQEVTGRRRGRVFGYHRYIAILDEGTTPLPRDSNDPGP